MSEARRRFSVSGNGKEKGFEFHLNTDRNPNSNTPIPRTPSTKLSSLSLKSVWLHDWWLARPDGTDGLAVGGFASRESTGIRTFCSTAIAKRHNTTTLETVDGITITISGLINRSRTHLNGFPSEVCNNFLLGFPYHWEEYANQHFGQESAKVDIPSGASCSVDVNTSPGSDADTLQPVSLDDIPVTRMRDLMMSPRVEFGNSHLQKEMINVLQNFCRSSVQDGRINAGQQYRPVKGMGKSRRRGQLEKDSGILTESRRVTRSVTRLKNLGNKQEQTLSSKSSVEHEKSGEVMAGRSGGDKASSGDEEYTS